VEFHQLRYFVAAAEEMSISKAALRVHVSQPALGRQIALLEEELGVALFARAKQRIHLTEAGGFFLTKARQLLCDAETAVQQLRESHGDGKRTLRIGFMPPVLDDVVTPALRMMRRKYPRQQLALFELSPRAQLDRLRDHELDLALLGNYDPEDADVFHITKLLRSRMALLLPSDHPLAGESVVDLKLCAGDPFISLSNTAFPGRREFLRSICTRSGFVPQILDEVESIALMIATVSAGAGIGILPQHCEKLPHRGCVFRKLKGAAVYAEAFLVRHREAPVGEAFLHLIQMLEQAGKEVS
jgi:DNA-binding transcriptional LysR family regulator